MADTARTFSKGELIGAVVAALAVGFFIGSMFMELRQGSTMPGPAAMQQGQAPAGEAGGQMSAPPELMNQIRDLEIATAQKPGDQAAWVDLGNSYFDAHMPQKSIAAYEKAVAIGPVSADVWTDLGIMHRELAQTQKALESFDAALKLDPRHQNALFNKGVVQLHDAGDRAGAAATWERLLQVNPEAKNPDGKPVKALLDELKKG